MKSRKDIEKTDVRKRTERKRYLNIIYFIDSNRTRTLKFSIEASYLTVGLISGAVLWSIISSVLLIRDRIVIAEMQDHARSLLGLVFNYQTRYDEVYERAYPASDDPMVAETAAEPKSADAVPSTLLHGSETKAALEKLAADSPKTKAVSKVLASKDPPLAVDNFSTRLSDGNLLIRLSLTNLNSPNKTSGSVHALAKFVDQSQKTHSLESHPTPSSDDVGDPEHFNIRYFKNKAFYFVPPKDLAGHFQEVLVMVTDNEGRSKNFQYPLSAAITTQDATITPTPENFPVGKAADGTYDRAALEVEQPR